MKKAFSLLLALVMCLSLIACSSEREAEQIEAIRSECVSIFDDKIESFLSTYDEYNITNVKYQIADISKHKGFTSDDDVYVISLSVQVICDDDNLSKAGHSLIAYDVLEIFQMPGGNQFYLAGTWCSYRPPLNDSNTYYDDRITIFVNNSYVMGPEDFELPETEKCRNCGRTENIVPGFGMCESCYEGFVDWQKDNWKD